MWNEYAVVKPNTKYKSNVLYVWSTYLNYSIIWHVVESIRVFYIFKRPLSTPLNIFKHASIKCLRAIDLKMTLLTLSLPLLHFLFVWSLWPHLGIVHSYGYVTIAVEGMQNLTYARNSRPLRWTGSVTSHTYCETGSPL